VLCVFFFFFFFFCLLPFLLRDRHPRRRPHPLLSLPLKGRKLYFTPPPACTPSEPPPPRILFFSWHSPCVHLTLPVFCVVFGSVCVFCFFVFFFFFFFFFFLCVPSARLLPGMEECPRSIRGKKGIVIFPSPPFSVFFLASYHADGSVFFLPSGETTCSLPVAIFIPFFLVGNRLPVFSAPFSPSKLRSQASFLFSYYMKNSAFSFPSIFLPVVSLYSTPYSSFFRSILDRFYRPPSALSFPIEKLRFHILLNLSP